MVARLFPKVFKCFCVHLIIICLLHFSSSAIPSSTVKYLPGFSGPLPFHLETGYIAVDEKEDVQYFYYFVESEGSPRDDPLILWFIGGPGCSGLSALTIEIGPIKFNMVEYNGTLPTLSLNPNSWIKAASIIFIDGPVGSGFSYSSSSVGSQISDFAFANQSFSFLKKWLLDHPKFISNPLYLGGDSYGGFIVPMVAEEVAKSIEASRIPKFNFQGYLVGNPRTDLNLDLGSRVPFAHRMGLISDELYKSVKSTCNGQYAGNHEKNTPCANDLNAISLCIDKINIQQILEPKCDSIFTANGKIESVNRKSLLAMPSDPRQVQIPIISFGGPPPGFPKFGCRNYETLLIHFWANDKAVQRALHVRKGTIKTWIRCPPNRGYKQQLESVVSYHQRLNLRGYRALIYSGDHDMMVPYIGTQAWIKSLNTPIVRHWRPWLVDDQVAGYVTEYSKAITFATVKGGGHTAPEYKPKECFAMFKRWISQEPL